MKKSRPTANDHESTRLLKPNEVAAQLRLSRASVYRLIASGVLPSVQVGRSQYTRVSSVDLDAYIAEHHLVRRAGQASPSKTNLPNRKTDAA